MFWKIARYGLLLFLGFSAVACSEYQKVLKDTDVTRKYEYAQKMYDEGDFKKALDSGREQAVKLQQHVPVHLVYFTAFPDVRGGMNYRRDIYGRDERIYDALIDAGVVPGGQHG